MEQAADDKKTRREQILDAAFSLEFTNNGWSLAEVAAAVGVSKTAIFRHFRNRAEIEAAMNARFNQDILEAIEKADFTVKGIRTALVGLFRARPGYLAHFMNGSFGSGGTPERYSVEYLMRESSKASQFFSAQEKLPSDARNRNSMTMLKSIISIVLASIPDDGKKWLQDELLLILERGFPEISLPSDARLDELERLCMIEESETESGNRLFAAIAAAIHSYGIEGTTIARIAEKMGTANSSLYFYYRNKERMLAELLKSETDTMIALNARRAGYAETIAEQLFILMMIQANYLLQKPDILPVYNWIRYETIRRDSTIRHAEPDIDRLVGTFRLDGLFPDPETRTERVKGLLKWASVLSTSIIVLGKQQRANDEIARKNVRFMLKSMINGDKEITHEGENSDNH